MAFKSQSGQSIVEFFIWGSLFAGIMLGLPILAKMADINHKHNEMVRYSLWERTVWTTDRKSDAALALEVEQRFMNHPAVALTDDEQYSNPFWQHREQTILAGDGNDENSSLVSFEYSRAPRENAVIRTIAYAGGIIGDLDLNGNGLATVTVQTRILDRYDENQDNRYVANTNDSFSIESTASILTDTWALENEGQLQSRIDNLSPIHEEVALIAVPGVAVAVASLPLEIAGLGLFEGVNAANVDNADYTEALDSKYIKDKP